MKPVRSFWFAPVLVFVMLGELFSAVASCAQETICHITAIEPKQLANAVQIVVRADGMLNYRDMMMEDRWDDGGRRGRWLTDKVVIDFPDAVTDQLGSDFVSVGIFPVGDIEFVTKEEATRGVGVIMTVHLLEPASYNIDTSPDRQELYITVAAETFEDVASRDYSGPEPPPEPEALRVECAEGRATVYASGVDIHQFFAALAQKAGLNIAVDDAVQRRVTVNLFDLAPGEVLERVSAAYALGWRVEDGVYMISEGIPRDLSTYRETVTEMIPMQYVPAAKASALLPRFLRQYVSVNTAQNAVVVSAPTEMVEKVRADLEKVDIPPPLIMVEALAVEFKDLVDIDLGFDMSWVWGEASLGTSTLDPDTTGDITFSSIGVLPSEFSARLRALVQREKARVKAAPRMSAMNGNEADIFIGKKKYVQVKTGYGAYEQTTIRPIDVGVTLEVTPWTGGNGEITTQIEAEVSNITSLDPVTGLPELSTRRAFTTIRVRDGETIAIGGLDLQEVYTTETRIPLLGDLPLLGQFFRGKSKVTNTSKLVIFVTPTMLSADGHLPDESRERDLLGSWPQMDSPNSAEEDSTDAD